ncbi:hypothetical protein EDD15DRAFT_2391694 [Pisolithus albus]|nr:hypothetical protein EDD15DRAFT_2391694 [Pisolithus albus]
MQKIVECADRYQIWQAGWRGRELPRLKHCCPASTYKLQDEPAMRFKMLFAQDGNDSLKRVATRVLDGNLDDTNQLTTSLPTLEHAFHHEQYLTHKFIEKFASDRQTGHSIIDEHDDGNLCVEHWKNMKDSVTQKMWNTTKETHTCKLIHSILGKHARSLNYTSLINAFHGHTHNRLCQLDNLMTYVESLRLEDLEGCECAFLKSNALALSTCYASTFHRRQAIACYFEHNDEMEVYANIMKFLLNNYKQALDLLSNGHATLEQLMCELGVSDPAVFRQWLDKERVYLKSLLWEPVEETLQMEYWQQLVNLTGSRITCHWVPEDGEWQVAACLIANCKYQHTLDNVECLVMLWIFELSKMNQSGTGKFTLLEFDEVVEDTWQDVSTRPWALPTACLAINTFFKLCRAEEEVTCLNVEIHHIVTYLIDEDRYLRACEALYRDTHPALAHQISIYHGIRSRFTPSYLHSLEKISRLPGFSGMLTAGVSLSCGWGDSASAPNRVLIESPLSSPLAHIDDDEDIDEDGDDDLGVTLEERGEALQQILSITMDV